METSIKKNTVEHQLRREIEILRLRHKHIIRLFTWFHVKERYLVLEYCCNGEVFNKLRDQGTFNENKQLDIYMI